MVKKYLLDTNIMIGLCNRDENIREFLGDIEIIESDISSINTAEFYQGIYRAKNREAQEKWYLDFVKTGQMEVLAFDEGASKIFAKIQVAMSKKGWVRPIMDLQIAAICMENNLRLVTKNLKDFEMIEGLKLYRS